MFNLEQSSREGRNAVVALTVDGFFLANSDG